MGFLSSIADVVSAGASLVDAFGGGDKDARKASGASQESARFAAEVARALGDPNSALFQQNLAAEREAQRHAFVQGLNDLIAKAGRLRTKGAPSPFGMSDRRDEAVASAVAKQRATGEASAREAARNALLQASQAAGVGVSAGSSAAKTAQEVAASEANRRAGGFDVLTQGARTLEDIFASNTTPSLESQARTDVRSFPELFGVPSGRIG